ncbi:MAG: LysR family transcriptional regulator [Pseudomonadota bacterium]
MSRALPPLNALRAFEAAGRHESFSRAAEELGVSHSAVSRHVRSLEHQLGAQLFRVAHPGVTLTPEGRAFLERVTPALDEISEATEAVGEAPAGRVIVSAETLFAQRVIAPRLVDFADRYPEIDLRIEASDTFADLDRYEADFAIRFLRDGTIDRATDLISDAPMFVYAAPGLFEQARPSASEIIGARRLQDRPADVWLRWARAAGIATDDIALPTWRLQASLAIVAAESGHGVYLSAADCVAGSCRAGTLRRVSDVCLREGTFHLIAQHGALRRRAQRLVREWLLDITQEFRVPRFWEIDQPIG